MAARTTICQGIRSPADANSYPCPKSGRCTHPLQGLTVWFQSLLNRATCPRCLRQHLERRPDGAEHHFGAVRAEERLTGCDQLALHAVLCRVGQREWCTVSAGAAALAFKHGCGRFHDWCSWCVGQRLGAQRHGFVQATCGHVGMGLRVVCRAGGACVVHAGPHADSLDADVSRTPRSRTTFDKLKPFRPTAC